MEDKVFRLVDVLLVGVAVFAYLLHLLDEVVDAIVKGCYECQH